MLQFYSLKPPCFRQPATSTSSPRCKDRNWRIELKQVDLWTVNLFLESLHLETWRHLNLIDTSQTLFWKGPEEQPHMKAVIRQNSWWRRRRRRRRKDDEKIGKTEKPAWNLHVQRQSTPEHQVPGEGQGQGQARVASRLEGESWPHTLTLARLALARIRGFTASAIPRSLLAVVVVFGPSAEGKRKKGNKRPRSLTWLRGHLASPPIRRAAYGWQGGTKSHSQYMDQTVTLALSPMTAAPLVVRSGKHTSDQSKISHPPLICPRVKR